MNILNKVALAYLKKNKTRTLVTIIGVVLSVGLMTIVTTLAASTHHLLIKNAITNNGDYTLRYDTLDQKGVDFLATLPQKGEVQESYTTATAGYLLLNNPQAPNNTSEEAYGSVWVHAYDLLAFQKRPLGKIKGHLPKNNHEILVSEAYRQDFSKNLKVGDLFSLDLITFSQGKTRGDEQLLDLLAKKAPNRKETYKIAGFVSPKYSSESGNRSYEFYVAGVSTLDQEQTRFLKLTHPEKWQTFKKKHQPKNTENVEISLNNELSELQGHGTDGMTTHKNWMILGIAAIFAGLIAGGSILLIHNAFAMSVNERLQQFGLLASIGATKKQIRRSVIFEGFSIALIGIPLGILVGLAFVILGKTGLIALADKLQEQELIAVIQQLTLTVNWQSLVAAACIGLIMILLSAWLPARQALKHSVMAVISQQQQIKLNAKKLRTGKLSGKLFGLSGTLAQKNFKRNKKAYRPTILSLIVSIVLFIGASALVMYGEKSIAYSFQQEKCDVRMAAYDVTDQDKLKELFAKYDQLTEIEQGGWSVSDFVTTTLSKKQLNPRAIHGNNPPFYPDDLEVYEGDAPKEKDIYYGSIQIVAFDDQTFKGWLKQLALPEEDYFDKKLNALGNQVITSYSQETGKTERYPLFQDDQPRQLTLRGSDDTGKMVTLKNPITLQHYINELPALFSSSDNPYLTAYLPVDNYNRLFETMEDTGISSASHHYLYQATSSNADQATKKMRTMAQAAGLTNFFVSNIQQEEQTLRNMLLLVKVIAYSFIAVISLIAIANVFNTISANLMLRRREFAMLESVGMSPKGFTQMMAYECLLYGSKALLWGLSLALALDFLLYKIVNFGIEQPFIIPWGAIAISIACVFIIVFITMLYGFHKLKKENIIDGLRGAS